MLFECRKHMLRINLIIQIALCDMFSTFLKSLHLNQDLTAHKQDHSFLSKPDDHDFRIIYAKHDKDQNFQKVYAKKNRKSFPQDGLILAHFVPATIK